MQLRGNHHYLSPSSFSSTVVPERTFSMAAVVTAAAFGGTRDVPRDNTQQRSLMMAAAAATASAAVLSFVTATTSPGTASSGSGGGGSGSSATASTFGKGGGGGGTGGSGGPALKTIYPTISSEKKAESDVRRWEKDTWNNPYEVREWEDGSTPEKLLSLPARGVNSVNYYC
jgi:hypothetical protein